MTLQERYDRLVKLDSDFRRLVALKEGRGYLTQDEKKLFKSIKGQLETLCSHREVKQLTIG